MDDFAVLFITASHQLVRQRVELQRRVTSDFQKFVLPLAFVNLTLKEFFVLLKGLRARLPILDLALQLVLIFLRLDLVFIQFLYTFLKICDDRVLQSSIFVALVQVHDQLLQLLFLLLDINGVAFQIVFLLFLQHIVQLDIEPVNNPVQLVAHLGSDMQLLRH